MWRTIRTPHRLGRFAAMYDWIGSDNARTGFLRRKSSFTTTTTTPSSSLDTAPPITFHKDTSCEGTTIVRDRDTAKKVLRILQLLEDDGDRVHACDTEVANISLKDQSPVGNGRVICASVYSGPDIDFGSGPRLWIDNLDDADGVLDVFRPFFSSRKAKKVWHNYGFDRHVLYNHDVDCLGLGGDTMHMARLWDTARLKDGGYSLEALTHQLLGTPKITMKERFGKPRIRKDGTEGKELLVPSVEELQRSEETRSQWIDYSVMDAELTWQLHEFLANKLSQMTWAQDRSMLDFYRIYLVPFGELLTDMERVGVRIDLPYLKRAEAQAREEMKEAGCEFREWATSHCEDARHMNIASGKQIQQLLFAPCGNAKRSVKEELPLEKVFKIENVDGWIAPGDSEPKKNREITIQGLGWKPLKATASGWPAVSADVLRELAGPDVHGDPPKFGLARDPESCRAIDALLQYSSIGTMLSNFITTLQEQADEGSRIHGSLNINTETGRLSSRRPNLQNQPALEKDRYKIRDAFICENGNRMIVADYGQLELRLLAHMTNCKSMIEAFSAGGDFHSRTAMGMYPYICDAVDAGDVLLEWDYAASEGSPPPVPLLKDKFASERRQAKVLNFSIAYGKTAHGLSKDFGVTVREAQKTLDRWYEDRPEVREWQKNTIDRARATGYTRTLMGRYRHLPDINSRGRAQRSHAERAAINTPIQGGAADVVMKAMLKIHGNEALRELGWKLLLQIHDEVILEGPAESEKEAMRLLLEDMTRPFDRELLVALTVDASCADTWYEAK